MRRSNDAGGAQTRKDKSKNATISLLVTLSVFLTGYGCFALLCFAFKRKYQWLGTLFPAEVVVALAGLWTLYAAESSPCLLLNRLGFISAPF